METSSSCISREALIKFGSGTAPVLDYNVPQKTCFNVYGRIPLRLESKYFTAACFKAPANNFWDAVKLKKEKDIQSELNDISISGYSNGILGTSLGPIANKLSANPVGKASEVTEKSKTLGAKKTIPAGSTYNSGSNNPLTDFMMRQLMKGLMPVTYKSFSGEYNVKYVERPEKPTPSLFCLETYTVCSYLGDYGAGKTLNVFSLLPGEKTEITVKTYLDSETTNTASQNILDSFSVSSANEFERLLKTETGSSDTVTNEAGLSLDVSGEIKGVKIGVGGGAKHTHETATNVSHIDQTTLKHTLTTNLSREVTINVTSSQTVKSGTETSIVRQIENINKSRVLNFVFRQLLQEYITLISLTNVKIVYTNGYPESMVTMNIFELEDKLSGIIASDKIAEVKNMIIKKYCTVYNYKGEPKKFLEKVTQNYKDCDCGNFIDTLEFCRVNKKLTDEAEGFTVNGVILNVRKQTLKTPAVVCDALLGQGEALDCYNMELQKAAVDVAKITNLKNQMALDIINAIPDTIQKASVYKDLFNPCCDDKDSSDA